MVGQGSIVGILTVGSCPWFALCGNGRGRGTTHFGNGHSIFLGCATATHHGIAVAAAARRLLVMIRTTASSTALRCLLLLLLRHDIMSCCRRKTGRS